MVIGVAEGKKRVIQVGLMEEDMRRLGTRGYLIGTGLTPGGSEFEVVVVFGHEHYEVQDQLAKLTNVR